MEGRCELEVNGAGREDAFESLNSMANYRSPDCLAVVVPRGILAAVSARSGADLEGANGERIVVEGAAKRVKVWLKPEVKNSEVRYYCQTHVRITSADQLALAD